MKKSERKNTDLEIQLMLNGLNSTRIRLQLGHDAETQFDQKRVAAGSESLSKQIRISILQLPARLDPSRRPACSHDVADTPSPRLDQAGAEERAREEPCRVGMKQQHCRRRYSPSRRCGISIRSPLDRGAA